MDQGSILNQNSVWNLTGTLVVKTAIPVNETICNKQNDIINAFLPIPELDWENAIDLCHKFGEDVNIAGNFETIEDFNYYYDSLHSTQKFIDQCGFYDNGRIKTWVPYKSQYGSKYLVNVNTMKNLLLGDPERQVYADWYGGPNDDSDNKCGAAYFGIGKILAKTSFHKSINVHSRGHT